MDKELHIKLNSFIYEEAKSIAKLDKLTLNNIVRESLIEYLINRKEASTNTNSFTFIDLFAGIGGMRKAFESYGGECVFTSEWDKQCQMTYMLNYWATVHGDITNIEASSIPDHDILVAGFPCQPFSIAGVSKKNSLGRAHGFLDKTQGTLFFDVARIIGEKRPKAFLLENVKNLKSHDKGRTFKIIMETLDALNYDVKASVLDANGYVPQHRERIFIVGFDRERYKNEINFSFPAKPDKKMKIADILEKKVDDKYTLSDKLWNYLKTYAQKHKEAGNGFGYGLVDLNGVARTLSARYYKDGSEILIPQEGKNPRRLTPRECARLQGYPDDFNIVVSDAQAYKQFGNSVAVPLIKAIAGEILKSLKSADTEILSIHIDPNSAYEIENFVFNDKVRVY